MAPGIRLSTPSSMPMPARRMGTTVTFLPVILSTSTVPHQPSTLAGASGMSLVAS
ncbi:Uncharacterised protein [Bordetella pertussis]|nr:Uncharacterised protein [Bordetella pertussis]